MGLGASIALGRFPLPAIELQLLVARSLPFSATYTNWSPAHSIQLGLEVACELTGSSLACFRHPLLPFLLAIDLGLVTWVAD